MPRKLKTSERGQMLFTGYAAFVDQPELGSLMSQCIAQWSNVELALGRFLLVVLGADPKPGYAMYSAIRSSSVQNETILRAAYAAFAEKYRPLLSLVMKALAVERKKRNEMAHHVWMKLESVPNSIVRFEPSAWLDFNISIHDTFAMRYLSNPRPPPPEIDWNKMFVYSLEDFKEIRGRFVMAETAVDMLINLFHIKPAETQDEAAETISQIPIIQELQKRN